MDPDDAATRMIAMEATIFTGWIYDHLLPHADKVKVAHPLMLRAIAAAKRKNDRIDAGKIADCLRCDFLPECHMASTEIRDRRRTLRYRSLVVKQMVQMKNRVSGLLMETDVNYNKQRLHKVGYFEELITTNEETCPFPMMDSGIGITAHPAGVSIALEDLLSQAAVILGILPFQRVAGRRGPGRGSGLGMRSTLIGRLEGHLAWRARSSASHSRNACTAFL
jgi:hypothetical protein